MSAYLCQPEHVTVIAAYTCLNKLTRLEGGDPVAVARHLYEANQAAMVTLYGDRAGQAPPFEFSARHGSMGYARQLPLLAIIKAVREHVYQACEWGQWKGSMAQKLCDDVV